MASNTTTPIPPFFRELREMLKRPIIGPTGIYTFRAVIEDMFVTLGIYSNDTEGRPLENSSAVNTAKYQQIRAIQGIIKTILRGGYTYEAEDGLYQNRVHQEPSILDRFGEVNLERSTYRDLITTYEVNHTTQGNFISKLLIFLSRIYSDENFFRSLRGRYPFKVLFSTSPDIVINAIVNNETEMKEVLLNSFFRMIGIADFNYQTRGGGIDYYGEPTTNYPDDSIPEDGDEDAPPADTLVLNRIRGSNISLTMMQYSQLVRGRSMPAALKLPTKVARSLINPNNTDEYCLIYCLIIASRIMYTEQYGKITNKLSLNKIDSFPIIMKTFKELADDFEDLFNEDDYIPINPENLAILESLFNININVYTITDSETCTLEIIHRSSFTNVQNDNVARLAYIPYSNMEPFKRASNVKPFNLASKTPEDFRAEIADGNFFDLNEGHFCLIPPNSHLIIGEKGLTNSYLLCPFCDTTFRGVKVFEEHTTNCRALQRTNDCYTTKMVPNPKGSHKKFSNYHTLSKCPFVIYGDTETQTSSRGHKLFSYFLYAKHESNPDYDLRIEDCARSQNEVGDVMIEEFMKDLTRIRLHIAERVNLYPTLDKYELEEFLEDNVRECCKFCGCVPIDKETGLEDRDRLVVHHDHNKPSPNIVGFLCQSCNIKESKINKSFPLVFHNLPYDLLVLIKILAVKQFRIDIDDEEVAASLQVPSSTLARTSMKYSSLTLKQDILYCQTDELETFREKLPEIRFIDSYAFVNSSLADIVTHMAKMSPDLKSSFPNTWSVISKDYPSIADELFAFSTQKGIIAYNHTTMTSMKSKTNLPKEKYKNDLDFTEEYYKNVEKTSPDYFLQLQAYKMKQEKILEEDYARSNKIFDVLKKHYGNGMSYKLYFLFYQRLDVLLLSDFFEWFRKTLIPTHKLDPAWFMGLPSYSQNCMLYQTQKTLHLIPDNVALSKLITSNLRGGLSVVISKMAENFEKNPLKRIASIDVNNLYGYVMQLMKIANEYVGEISLTEWEKELETYTDAGDYTYFLLTDVDASEHALQDRIKQLPPLVSKKNVDFSHLSKDQKKYKEENYRSEKLCCTLENQTDYLMHQRNYNFYTKLGYKITVKKIYKFKQEYIYKTYIELNSALRQGSLNDFAKALYKLLNNIIFGKSLQRNDDRDDIEILSDDKLILKRLINPRLKKVDIIKNDELVMTNTTPREAKFDTCIQAGFTILELSKLHIYTMLYDSIEPFCVEHNVDYRLLYSDTDSLYMQYDFEGSDFSNYNDYMLALNNATGIIDMSSFKDPRLHDDSRKKQVGLFLDEEADQEEIVAFVALCSKSYCTIKEKNGVLKTYRKGKGVSGRYLEAAYTYDDYKACSEGKMDGAKSRLEFNNIMRKNYQNVTTTVNKIGISNFDDKMYHFKNEEGAWDSLPHGHYKIAEIEAENEISENEPENQFFEIF